MIVVIKVYKFFEDIVYQVGVVVYYVVQVYNFFNILDCDVSEKYYYVDFVDYFCSMEDCLEIVFYGLDCQFEIDWCFGGEGGYIECMLVCS